MLYVCNVDEASADRGNPHSRSVFDRASGEGAESAVKALVELVKRDFDEAAEGEAHVRTA